MRSVRSSAIGAVALGLSLCVLWTVPVREATAEDSLVRPGKRPGGAKARPGGAKAGPGGAKARPGSAKAGPGGAKARPGIAGGERPEAPTKVEVEEAEAGGAGAADTARNRMLIERYLGILEARPGEQFALTRLVDLYRTEHGTLAPLLERFEQQVAADARAWAARMVLGELYRRGGRAEDGMRLLEEAAAIRPADAAPQLAMARLAEELGRPDAARAALEEALRLSTGQDRQDVLRQLRDALVEQGDLDAARARHGELVRATGSSLYVRLELGQALARAGRHREAVEELEGVARQVTGDARARVPVLREMAASQLELGEEDAALETLRTARGLTQPGSGERAEILELMVDVYRRRDALREVIDLLEDEPGGGFERAELLGRLCDELALAADAERWYRTALRADARHVDTRVRLIRLLVRQGRVEEATAEYETLVRHAPREPRFVTELAEMYLRTGQRARALELLARTSRTSPSDVAVHSALLDMYGSLGEEDLAMEEARILTRIDPRDERHLVELGERYFQQGDRERALATWRRIPTMVPERWRGLALLGEVYADHEMTAEALDLYAEALRLSPAEVSVMRQLASLFERLSRWDDAIRQWEQVIAAAGETDAAGAREARTRIVTIWANQRQLPQHVVRLRQRFAGTPPDVEAGRFLYEALERLARLDESTAAIRRVIELRPGDVDAHLALERNLVRQGALEEATEVLRRLLELAPRRSRELYQRLAGYAMQMQRDEDALEYAAQALALNPDDAQGHHRLAQLYRQQGVPERAIVEYRRAIELDDRLYDAYLELAELHETRSETAEAARVYLRLLSKAPDDALVARAGRQALLLSVMDGTVARLEHELLPLALAHTERVVYRRVLVALYGNLTWSLIQTAAYGGADEAAAAAQELRAVGQRSLQPLLDSLLDADPEQQEAAVAMLGHLGNPSAAVPLVAFARGDASPELRARALVAAGQVGDERIVDDLVELLDGAGAPALREAAAYGLARIASRPAVTALARHAEGPAPELRALACVGLGRAGDARHLALLRARLREDGAAMVQAAAAWALGLVRDDEATGDLVRALRSGPTQVRRAAAWALGARDAPDARRELAAALFDEEREIRDVAAWALRRAGAGPLAAPGTDAYHRMPGGRLRVAAYLDDLTRLDDAGSAAAALSRAGEQIESALDQALGGRGRPRRERIAVALRALEAPAPGRLGLVPLVRAAELDDEAVRGAMEPVVRIAVTRATALLDHPDVAVRTLATGVLGQAAGDDAFAGLVRALGDADPAVRHLALEHLGRRADARAVEPVAALLEDERWSTRARAVRALGRIAAPDAVAPLARAAREDSAVAVRVEAVAALAALGRPALATLAELARAPAEIDPAVRREACHAARSLDPATPCELADHP